jgi:hypothetical protein
MRNEYRMLLDEPDKKRVFQGHIHKWEYNIKTDTKENIYGDDMWRSRYNYKLYKLHNESDILKVIKVGRLR